MNDLTQWKQLSAEDALTFINAVCDSNDRILFEPSLCNVFSLPLDFYDGYELIRISNQYSPPFMIMDFVSNGENHYYLDGSDFAFQSLCQQDCLRLNEEKVLSYIDMYFSYVYERGNSIVFIRDAQDTNFKGSDGMGVHFKAMQKQKETSVIWSDKDDSFVIHAPLLYQDETRTGVVHVSKNGRIDVINPLNVSFLGTPKGHESIPYLHPKGDEILQQTKDILVKSTSGKRLLDIAEEKNVEIRVLSSPNYQAVTINKPLIYMMLPAAQYTADFHQALILAGALRDVEQILGGYPRPSKDESPEVFFAANCDKNLNLLCEICKIADEFDAQNEPEALSALRRLGIEDIYSGYKNNASPNEMLDIYTAMMVKQGFIVES